MVSTHLKNIRQIWSFPQVKGEKKSWNHHLDTVDGRNPAPPGMYKPWKQWDKLPTSSGVGFLQSTVARILANWRGNLFWKERCVDDDHMFLFHQKNKFQIPWSERNRWTIWTELSDCLSIWQGPPPGINLGSTPPGASGFRGGKSRFIRSNSRTSKCHPGADDGILGEIMDLR